MVDDEKITDSFSSVDKGAKGYLTRMEVQSAIFEVTNQDFDINHIEILYQEFDKNEDGKIDLPEFKTMMSYLRETNKKMKQRKSLEVEDLNNFAALARSYASLGTMESHDASIVLNRAVKASRRDSTVMLKNIAKNIFPVQDILCIQKDLIPDFGASGTSTINEDDEYMMHRSMQMNFDDLLGGESFADSVDEGEENILDPAFEAAFPASEMRCLALVSHNGMKKTMREFVLANKNLLKKFRLTGTNSTMTMLKEVFKNEPPGTVVFGPACSSGPLGGDAELVAHMVNGKIGGIFFFQDPMDSHPHRADIDCLVRQALVHNTMLAETPTSALMLVQTLRMALIGSGRAELIPSFFFSLQSPTVEAYKAQQKSVVDAQKAQVNMNNTRMSMAYPGKM